MKYFTRLNIYKAPNVSFCPVTLDATSYGWWVFVRKIKGKVVFNSFPYSVTTRKHQTKVRNLLSELGISIDLEVNTKMSLDSLEALEDALKAEQGAEELLRHKALTARSNKQNYLSSAKQYAKNAVKIAKLLKELK